MAKITKEAALLYHSQGKPGKIEVVPTNLASKSRRIHKTHTNILRKVTLLLLFPTVQPYSD